MADLGNLGQLYIQIEGRTDRIEKAFARVKSISDKRFKEMDTRAKQGATTIEAAFGRTATSITRGANVATAAMLRMGSAIGVALSVREVLQAADAWQGFQNKLKGAGVPVDQVAGTLDRLTSIALRTRSQLGAVTDLFSKLTLVSEQYNLSADQAARVTETVSKAMKAGGATAQEQASAILQLSQAIGSGVLQGDELRSLRENAPLLVKALAKELKTTTGEMKKLGEEGKLTSDVILKALLNASGDIDAAFGKTLPTLSDGFTNATTSFTALVGEFDRGAGITQQLAKALAGTSASLDDLRSSAAGWGAIVAQEAGKAIAAIQPLLDIINTIAKYSPTGLLAQWVGSSSEFERGAAMLKRGLGTSLGQDVNALYDFRSSGTGNIKAPAKDYGKKTDDLLRSIQDRTEALKVEIATFGKSTYEVERAKAAQELLAKAKQSEIPITDSLRGKIDAASTAYAQQVVRLEELKKRLEILNEFKSSASEFASSFAKDMASGKSAVRSLSNALTNLQNKLIDLAASKLIEIAFSTSGTSSLFSQLLGHAEGGLVRGAGTGTSDSNLRRVSNGEFIVRADQTAKYLDLLTAINSGKSLQVPAMGGQTAISAPNINQTFAPTIQVTGGTVEQNADAADRMEAKMRSLFEEFYNAKTVKEMRYGGLFSRK